MAILTVVNAVEAGLQLDPVAASAGGDEMANDGKTLLFVRNSHATLSRTVTFDVPNTDNFGVSGAGLDRAVVVPALEEMLIGPFNTAKFNTGTGKIIWTYSSEADLTIRAVRVNAVA